ncbi:MAG: chromosome segregation protein SMC [Eubacteriales bacterium]|nr:chromosome segregation protein SMC [Eubacteriales bacterium]
MASYRNKKLETERKLSSTTQNIQRINDIISELDLRVGPLKEESIRAKEYVELRDRYKLLEVSISVRNIADLQSALDAISSDISELNTDIFDKSNLLNICEQRINDLREESSSIRGEERDLNFKLEEIDREITASEHDRTVSNERLNSLNREEIRIKSEINILLDRLKVQEKDLVSRDSAKEATDLMLKQKADIYNKEKADIELMKIDIEKQQSIINDLKNSLFDLTTQKNNIVLESSSLNMLLQTFGDRFDELKKKLAVLDSDMSSKEREIADIRGDKSKQELELLDLDKDIKKSLEEVRVISSEYTKKKEILNDEIHSLNRTKARCLALEEMENNLEGYSAGVKFVLRNKLNGIVGTVADLSVIPNEYATAIETILGASTQNIVCETDNDAKLAVDLLRKNKAGRATFLPINSIKDRPQQSSSIIENYKGFIGYGNNVIEFEEKYGKIFKYLLANTVVVKDIDDAIYLSKKEARNYRYVTLKGEIVNSSGTITGGEYKNKTGNIISRKSEIIDLKKDIVSAEDRINSIKKEVELLNADIEAKNSELDRLKHEYQYKEFDLKNLDNSITVLTEQLDNISNENSIIIADLEQLSQKKTDGNKNVVDMEDKLKEIDILLSDSEKEIEEREANFKLDEEKYNSLSERMTALQVELSRSEAQAKNEQQLYELSKTKLDEISEEINNKKNKIESIFVDRASIKEGLGIRNEKIMKLRIDKENLQTSIADVKSKLDSFEMENQTLINDIAVLNKDLQAIQTRKFELDIKRTKNLTQKDNLEEKLWSEFEMSLAEARNFATDDIAISTAIKENRELKARIRALGNVNIASIEEYEEVSERYEFLTKQREDINKAISELESIIEDLEKIIKTKFKKSFKDIANHFEEVFVSFFKGGNAKILLTNEEDPLNSEIQIVAQPPGKQLKNINLLSGGEKTMTAIALMFAVLKTKPTPCCILDEVEAALDENNIHVFANYLKNFNDVQFTLITHQKSTMEHADVMYGITMPERGVSKIFSLKMN